MQPDRGWGGLAISKGMIGITSYRALLRVTTQTRQSEVGWLFPVFHLCLVENVVAVCCATVLVVHRVDDLSVWHVSDVV